MNRNDLHFALLGFLQVALVFKLMNSVGPVLYRVSQANLFLIIAILGWIVVAVLVFENLARLAGVFGNPETTPDTHSLFVRIAVKSVTALILLLISSLFSYIPS